METPESSGEFETLIRRLRSGDEGAAAEIFDAYSRRLARLVGRRLGDRLQNKFSPESVVQSAFGTFFRRVREGRLELRDSAGIWSLLVRIALNKCGHRLDYWLCEKRNPAREISPQPSPTESAPDVLGIAREPTPDEAAALEELLDAVTQELSEIDRQILDLYLSGEPPLAIAEHIGRTRRTVDRCLQRIRLRLSELLGVPSED